MVHRMSHSPSEQGQGSTDNPMPNVFLTRHQVRYRKRKRGPQPVACVGCREWIFSENSGALASFAAATEFTFGTIVQV